MGIRFDSIRFVTSAINSSDSMLVNGNHLNSTHAFSAFSAHITHWKTSILTGDMVEWIQHPFFLQFCNFRNLSCRKITRNAFDAWNDPFEAFFFPPPESELEFMNVDKKSQYIHWWRYIVVCEKRIKDTRKYSWWYMTYNMCSHRFGSITFTSL